MKRARIGVASALALLLTQGQPELPGCGPYFSKALFSFERYPLPVEEYAGGRLGVVEPTLWRKFLFTAYRYFTNAPLSAVERAAVAAGSPESSATPTVPAWLDARVKIAGVGRKEFVDLYGNVPWARYESYWNCTSGGFRTAVETLEARSRALGRAHPALRRWLEAQDAVFSNCGGGGTLPAPAEPDLPVVLRFDRAYQIAAAHFYAGRFDEAESRFRAIAADQGSPWAPTAALLVARTLVRKGTLVAGEGKIDALALGRAEEELQAILHNPRLAALYPSARRLLGFTAIKLRPAARLAELSAALERPASDAEVRQRVTDFQVLMDKVEAGSIPRAEARAARDMTDWIMTFQESGPEPLERALSRWKATKSLPWLVAAVTKVPADHRDAGDVLAAAERVVPDSPAFATLTYHRARLLRARGNGAAARQLLDEILSRRDAFTESAINRFLHERFELAVDFDELLRFAPRVPVAADVDQAMGLPEARDPLFDRDSVRVFNRGLPLELLARASAGASIPAKLRASLAAAAWTRAILLEEHGTARTLASSLGEIDPDARPWIEGYRAASGADERRFAASFLILHLPGLKPYITSGLPVRDKLRGMDDLRENWWCEPGLAGSEAEDSPIFSLIWTDARTGTTTVRAGAEPARILDAAAREALEREWKKLMSLDTAPNHLASIVLARAKAHPDDKRVPEALHLVVRATRFGCTNKKTSAFSRAAFQLLHRRYPGSPWARTTKFWY